LPHTFIVVAEVDILQSEGEAYAQKLSQDNVPTTYKRYKGMPHSFLTLPSDYLAAQSAREDSYAFHESAFCLPVDPLHHEDFKRAVLQARREIYSYEYQDWFFLSKRYSRQG